MPGFFPWLASLAFLAPPSAIGKADGIQPCGGGFFKRRLRQYRLRRILGVCGLRAEISQSGSTWLI
ncbi:MAG: hypothetical protein LBU32_28010 [Clostridiales bacterium]|nr:hypothetical protein [Clostridiales bacterium]